MYFCYNIFSGLCLFWSHAFAARENDHSTRLYNICLNEKIATTVSFTIAMCDLLQFVSRVLPRVVSVFANYNTVMLADCWGGL